MGEESADGELKPDIGLPMGDVMAIKASLLTAVRDGKILPAGIEYACGSLINSFKALNEQAFIHTEVERSELEKASKDRLTPQDK